MTTADNITSQLLARLFTHVEAQRLKSLAKLLEKAKPGEPDGEIWEFDQSLGGLGGFAMPADPTVNPFNTWGKDRNIFRSIQYAKSSLTYNPTYPRSVIVDVGRVLEIMAKYMNDHYSIISRLQNNYMLGKNLRYLHDKKVIDDELYDTCRALADLTNLAKHEISVENSRSFSSLDGLVAYFSMRKINNQLLTIIEHPRMKDTYLPYRKP